MHCCCLFFFFKCIGTFAGRTDGSSKKNKKKTVLLRLSRSWAHSFVSSFLPLAKAPRSLQASRIFFSFFSGGEGEVRDFSVVRRGGRGVCVKNSTARMSTPPHVHSDENTHTQIEVCHLPIGICQDPPRAQLLPQSTPPPSEIPHSFNWG